MSIFKAAQYGYSMALDLKIPPLGLLQGVSSTGLTKMGCALPQDDKAQLAAHLVPHVLSCLLWSADNAQKGAICPTHPSLLGVSTRAAPAMADDACSLPHDIGDHQAPGSSHKAAVLPPDAGRRSVTHTSMLGYAHGTADDGPKPGADSWAAAPTASGASLALGTATRCLGRYPA
ncbi:hypothetical protein C8R44DRAFT_873340 [Mycena epipterygia]|nr:hypothetical protein C8R44DRAFT_873340 [Mycena epipterygia]